MQINTQVYKLLHYNLPKIRLFFCLIICLYSSTIYGQTSPTREIVVYCGDTTINTRIFIKNPKIKIKARSFYFWHRQDTINSTQGGYTGKLLHGNTEFFAPQKVLIKQGQFKQGLKVGKWQEWHPNGFIKKVEYWKEGALSGYSWEYDQQGQLASRRKYKNNIQKGNTIEWKNGKKILNVTNKKEKLSQKKLKPEVKTNPIKEKKEPKNKQKEPKNKQKKATPKPKEVPKPNSKK